MGRVDCVDYENLVGEVTTGKINNSTKNNSSHLDVLSLNISKERNRRTFEGTTRTLAQVLGLIKEELGLFSRALGKLQLPP